jgi:hypothetical protein
MSPITLLKICLNVLLHSLRAPALPVADILEHLHAEDQPAQPVHCASEAEQAGGHFCMSPLLRCLTTCRHPFRQLVTPEGRQGRALLRPVLHHCQDQCSLPCRSLRSMHAQASSAQSEEFQFLVTSSDDGSLAVLRSSLSQVSCICWRSTNSQTVSGKGAASHQFLQCRHRRMYPLHQTPLHCRVSS